MNVLCGIYVNIAVRTKCWKLTLSLRNSTPAEKKPNILEKEVLVKYNYWSKYFKLLGLQTGLGSRLISVFHLLKQVLSLKLKEKSAPMDVGKHQKVKKKISVFRMCTCIVKEDDYRYDSKPYTKVVSSKFKN